MNFFIENIIDYEYVVVDLDDNIKISGGSFDLDDPSGGAWINNIFVDLSTPGFVTAHKLQTNTKQDASLFWQTNYNTSLEIVGSDGQKIYLLDIDGKQIIVVDTQSGVAVQSKPLLWFGKNILVRKNNFIVQSANKLFVVQM